MGQSHGAVPNRATIDQRSGAPRTADYDKIQSVVSTWQLQAPGEWLVSTPAPILTGKSRPCDDILHEIDNGSFASRTKDRYKGIHEAISPDTDPISSFVRLLGAMKAGGIASLPKKALKLLEHEVPTRSILCGKA